MNDIFFFCDILITQACFASLVSQDYVNGTDQEEIRTGKNSSLLILHLVCFKPAVSRDNFSRNKICVVNLYTAGFCSCHS